MHGSTSTEMTLRVSTAKNKHIKLKRALKTLNPFFLESPLDKCAILCACITANILWQKYRGEHGARGSQILLNRLWYVQWTGLVPSNLYASVPRSTAARKMQKSREILTSASDCALLKCRLLY
jgi:hypothetical protein